MRSFYIILLGLLFSVSAQAQCTANYTYTKDSTTVYFSDSSDGDGNLICSYLWDFGDQHTSSAQNPTHTYDSAATYTVCLEIITASDSSCSDTICVNTTCIDISVLQLDTFIRGKVYAKSNLLPEGMILLINAQNKVIDKASISTGEYYFYTLPDTEDYTLYAVPYFDVDEEYYPQYFPTYTGDKLHWQSANTITKNTLY